ncbi:MAG TPA: DotA/TraY family protein [Gammaproteobacteria bacterium]|nr:DotA/TraY family protein [Gammaproteobacteria bacterium]
MIDLFNIPQNDQSVAYLGQIFGMVGSVLPVAEPTLLVGMMFKTLNTMVLTIGAFMVLYVTVVGLLKTAQEGEFLGRQWNSLWVPLRTVMGILALFPTSTGYSAIQIIIMWLILQGVGAADVLWSRVIDYVSVAGSPYSAVNSASLNPSNIRPQMISLFRALVCQASAKATYAPIDVSPSGGTGAIKYYCNGNPPNQSFCNQSESEMLDPLRPPTRSAGFVASYPIGPDGQCGVLAYCDMNVDCAKKSPTETDSGQCLACKAQRSALQAIVPTLGSIANKFVDLDYQYAKFYEAKPKITERAPEVPDFIQEYCSANGIEPAQCCAPFSAGCAATSQTFPRDFPENPTGKNNYTDTSYNTAAPLKPTTAATDLYMKYSLGAYLNGSDFINAAVGEYTAALVAAVAQGIENDIQAGAKNWRNPHDADWATVANSAKGNGWIMAGAFYYKIAAINRKNVDALQVKFEMPIVTSPLSEYRNNYTAVYNMLSVMTGTNAGSASFSSAPGGSDITYALGASASSLLASWMNSLQYNTTNATNPLVSMAVFGYQMMVTAQTLFFVITAAIVLAVGFGTINVMFVGTGLTMNPIGEAIKSLIGLVSPFFILLIGALFSIGALLGMYVPLIPYMVFTMGGIGWLLATVEAMVAGPIIALGILSPGGQHDILGRAEPALMQIFNLFLRPSLMIIGMMVAMLMSIVVVRFVNTGFLAAVTTIGGGGLFEQIIFIAIYTSFIVTVLNKAFSLIYVIPERVLTWIGGPAVSYQEGEALQAAKQAVESAGGAATGAAKETGGGAMHAGMATKYARKEGKGKSAVVKSEGGESGKSGGNEPDG